MEKIDRLGWAAGTVFVSYGVRVGIRANDPAILKRIQPYLPHDRSASPTSIVELLYSLIVGGSTPGSRVRRYNLLYEGWQRIARTMDLEELLDSLESTVRFHVAVLSPNKLFVHAGVAAWRGRAIVIPGRSFSGKTTLVDALVRAGATYYSDEFAIFDSRGRVHPYPKPLNMRAGTQQRATRMPVESIGGRSGKKPLPVGIIVVSEYEAGARWRPRHLSKGEAMLALLAHTLRAQIAPDRALSTLERVTKNAVIYKGKRGEAGELAQRLLDGAALNGHAS